MPSAPRRSLVLGGARSGKSAFAESLLDPGGPCRYVATGHPAGESDPEWAARVAAHRARRPAAWTTLETDRLTSVLAEDGPPLLVDGLGLWLARVLDRDGLWAAGEAGVRGRLEELAAAWRACPARAVAVSEEVGFGVVPVSASGRLFRDALGTLNQLVAGASEEVWLVVAGLPQRLK